MESPPDTMRKPRTTTAFLAAILVTLLVALPGSALAKPERGDGPYTPFPDDPSSQRAKSYVDQLNQKLPGARSDRTVTPSQLTKGVTLRSGRPARAPAAEGKTGEHTGTGARDAKRASSSPRALDRATPFARAGFAEASAPPDPSPAPYLALGCALALAALGVGAYRRRRRWAQ
jgi:hypothetical protein